MYNTEGVIAIPVPWVVMNIHEYSLIFQRKQYNIKSVMASLLPYEQGFKVEQELSQLLFTSGNINSILSSTSPASFPVVASP